MGRYRSRSRSLSYSPRPRDSRSPRPRYSRSPPRRKYYDEPRDSYRGGGGGRGSRDYRSAPSGLLVRNIALDARPEDLRIPFERFGAVKDVYLPKNYYTGEPRGFGFVKFRNPDDAAEAKYHMNHKVIGGREISIVFAEENRKTPQDMRMTSRVSDRYSGGGRRRSPPRSSRGRYRSYSRSPSPLPRRDSSGQWTGVFDMNDMAVLLVPIIKVKRDTTKVSMGYNKDQREKRPESYCLEYFQSKLRTVH